MQRRQLRTSVAVSTVGQKLVMKVVAEHRTCARRSERKGSDEADDANTRRPADDGDTRLRQLTGLRSSTNSGLQPSYPDGTAEKSWNPSVPRWPRSFVSPSSLAGASVATVAASDGGAAGRTRHVDWCGRAALALKEAA
jgi:hypothetical protein